ATGQSLPAATFSGGEQTVVALLTRLGFDVRDTSVQHTLPEVRIGDVPGIDIGTVFASRREAAAAGIHRAIQAGITGTGATGAESIVVSGGYEDDQDHGWEIVYTGHGGRDGSGRQTSDQTFEAPGNAALQTSHLTGAPVRVVRGAHRSSAHAPQSGYRYDGLFRVVRVWRERGLSGHLICRFTMVALGAGPVTERADPEQTGAATDIEPTGTDAPDRRAASVQRLVRSVQVAEYVKKLHDHTCQACGTRLAIGSRAYSEGAHIRALGRPHNGPDVPANMLCLCPNCHVLFDNGALLISDDLAMTVNGDLTGALRMHGSHVVERAHLAYHRSRHL
ncbi:MAG: hypothetical protein JWP75_3516, partial [Frondihabitans sp.]|nr:hypothetical protein [Frondihabitans sp.]